MCINIKPLWVGFSCHATECLSVCIKHRQSHFSGMGTDKTVTLFQLKKPAKYYKKSSNLCSWTYGVLSVRELLYWLEHPVFLHGIAGKEHSTSNKKACKHLCWKMKAGVFLGLKTLQCFKNTGVASYHLLKVGTSSVVFFFTYLVCENILIIFIFWKLNFSINLSSNRSRKAEPWHVVLDSAVSHNQHILPRENRATLK